jgi:DNA-directed RNA polymerase specialized sigma24 family protein
VIARRSEEGCKVNTDTRKLAKALAKGLPVEGAAFGEHVDRIEHEVKALPKVQKTTLTLAYMFSAKVPHQERDDVSQEILLACLESGQTEERNLYVVARRTWVDWFRKWYTRQQYELGIDFDKLVAERLGINEPKLEGLCNVSGDMTDLVAETRQAVVAEHETKATRQDFDAESEYALTDSNPEAKRIWNSLPARIQAIARKRLASQPLTHAERQSLSAWLVKHENIVCEQP